MGTAGRRPRWPRVGAGGSSDPAQEGARVLGGWCGGWLEGKERECRALFSDTAYLLKKKYEKSPKDNDIKYIWLFKSQGENQTEESDS